MRIRTLAYVACLAIFLILVSVSYSAYYLIDKSNILEETWQKFDENAVTRLDLIKDIQTQMGYGGMIHNFKNYILRKDTRFLINFYKSAREIDILIGKYNNLGIRKAEKHALNELRKTKNLYKQKAVLAEQLINSGKAPSEIDPLVKVNDIPALNELQNLKVQIKKEHLQQSRAVEKLVKLQKHYIYYVTLLKAITIVFSLILLFYLAYKRITKPLLAINHAMNNIKDDNLEINIPYKTQKDEIGELALAVQVFLNRTRELKIKESEINIYIQELHTKQKQLEKEIKNAQTADNANKMKSEFLATMSHEIRTPMNGIIGTAELMLVNKLNKQQKNEVKVILKSAETLLEIINGILDFSKIEAGQVTLEDKPFNLTKMLDEVTQVIAPVIYKKKLELITDIEPDVNQNLIGDPLRIKQILTNLLGNAVKFTEKGYITVHIKKDISTVPLQGFEALIFEIKDTGIGITPSIQETIFDKFTQADSSTTRTYGGTGLGLSISKELVKLMRGNIGLHSTLEKGSTFWFKLVLQEDHSTETQIQKVKKFTQEMHAILIDETQNHRDFIKKELHHLNIKTNETTNLDDAYSLLNSNPDNFSFIILNIQNSHHNLRRHLKHIKSTSKDIRIIVLANPTTPSDMNNLYNEHHIDALVQKPVHLTNLSNAIHKALNSDKDSTYKSEFTNPNKDSHAGKKALLVEDNEINITIGSNMLQMFGLEVTTAVNGLEALEAIKEKHEQYDIIFMDCQMPVMDGYTAAYQIKELRQKNEIKDTPVIALTANAMKGDYQKCMNSGMDDYISKPIHIDSLNLLLDKWLNDENKSHPTKIDKGNPYAPKLEEVNSEQNYDKSLKEAHNLLKNEFQTLLNKFFKDSEKCLEKIIKGYTEHNKSLIEKSAHKLKSSSLQVGAKLLSSVAEEIEFNVKSYSDEDALFAELETKLPYLKQSLEKSHKSLRMFAEENILTEQETKRPN